MNATATAFQFDDPRLAWFVRGLTIGPEAMDAADRSVPVRDEIETRLLMRLNEGKTSVLRYRGTGVWMITGFDERDLVQTVARLERFLTPSYGRFSQRTANVQPFDPTKGAVQALGRQLSLAGYHRLETEPRYLAQVRAAIRNWMQVEERRPSSAEKPRPTYRELMSAFRTALATSAWAEAEQIVEETSRHRLTSADNVVSLTLQLRAKREQWSAIWHDPHFGEWARQRIPRAIRTALIQSFHHTVLLPRELEGDWAGALELFRRERPRLGNLLETRLQENSPPVASVFAYGAVDGADHPFAAALRETLPDDVLQRITPILDLLPPLDAAPEAPPTLTVETQAKIALLDGNLDQVRTLVRAIDDAVTRTVLLVDLANRSRDLADVEFALTEVTDLPRWRLHELHLTRPYLNAQIEELEALFVVPKDGDLAKVVTAPLTWRDWLAALIADGRRPDLEPALESLIAKSDERLWEPADAKRIADDVLAIVADSHNAPVALVRRALDALIDGLLIDSEFPRSGPAYADLYEATYTYLVDEATVNDANSRKLLRLAEAILAGDPSRVHDIHRHLRQWLAVPRPVLADRMLDGLELVAEYGIDGGALVGDVRPWADALLASPAEIPATTIRAWTAFATAIQAGADLITQLRDYGAAHAASFERLVAGLPRGFRIAIFTLRPKSAARVKEVLESMNPALDVQISDEKDLSPRVQHLATSADLPVVVTTCITHALTYGIGPYLKSEPARPDSPGSTSIMRSIEAAVAAL